MAEMRAFQTMLYWDVFPSRRNVNQVHGTTKRPVKRYLGADLLPSTDTRLLVQCVCCCWHSIAVDVVVAGVFACVCSFRFRQMRTRPHHNTQSTCHLHQARANAMKEWIKFCCFFCCFYHSFCSRSEVLFALEESSMSIGSICLSSFLFVQQLRFTWLMVDVICLFNTTAMVTFLA